MANYMPQPDGSNTCCDCPDRASPCDDCVALSCGDCEVPTGCAHMICFQVKFSQDEIDAVTGDNDTADILQMGTTGLLCWSDPNFYRVVRVDPFGWYLPFPFSGGFIDASDVPWIADHWYQIMVGWSAAGFDDPVTITLCVDGFSDSFTLDRSFDILGQTFQNLRFGSMFTSGTTFLLGRRYKNIQCTTGFDDTSTGHNEFNFPTDSFDSLVNATVITEDGDQVLFIDSNNTQGYGEFVLNPGWNVGCRINLYCLQNGRCFSGCSFGGGCNTHPPAAQGGCLFWWPATVAFTVYWTNDIFHYHCGSVPDPCSSEGVEQSASVSLGDTSLDTLTSSGCCCTDSAGAYFNNCYFTDQHYSIP